MGSLATERFNQKAQAARATETRENMRAIGFFFLLMATASLAWDANIALTGYGLTGLSGILQIWQMIDKTSLEVIQQLALVKLGYNFWFYVAMPFMSLPAVALFGLTGLLMLRKQSHEIKLRSPTAHELEMISQGINPRRARR